MGSPKTSPNARAASLSGSALTEPARPDAVARDGSFEEALVTCRPRLFRVALLMLGGREEAEDATQRVLLKALEGRARFRGEAEVYTWLYRILVNLCKDVYKARSRASRWLAEVGEIPVEPVAAGPSSEEVLATRERDERLRRALAGLEPRLREILVLRHYEELSYEEIAGVLDCPVGTVRSRLSAGRERLRDAYERSIPGRDEGRMQE